MVGARTLGAFFDFFLSVFKNCFVLTMMGSRRKKGVSFGLGGGSGKGSDPVVLPCSAVLQEESTRFEQGR